MRVDQDVAQALDAEPLDEAHAAHVGREVVHLRRAVDGAPAVGFEAQVEADALDAGDALVPLRQRLLVDRADPPASALVEVARPTLRR